jgi:para-nitrobenzyl esterase
MRTVELQTALGRLRGIADNQVQSFLGVPYAKPPVQERRFAAPQPIEPWSDVRDATVPGPNAPHRLNDFSGLDTVPLVGEGWIKGDDYLTLNIWRPAAESSGFPVMVFIHGGGFVVGSKDAPVQNGRGFARDGVICVSINYRLGVEGFLPIPGVPTNLGLRDQICALEWVREYIADYGGDPSNITVFGESAGAMSVANLITSPMAKDLFQRAIVQSGHGAMTRDIDVAQRLVRKVAKFLNVPATKAGFETASIEACLDAVQKVSQPTTLLDLRNRDGRDPVFGISRFVPVHGDDVLPQQPLEALKQGVGADIDVLIGTNAEEMNLYLVPTGMRDKVGGLLATYVLSKSLPKAREVLKAYGLKSKDKKAGQALVDAMTDLVFRWPARRFAEEHLGRTHLYEFGWRSPAFRNQLGASHGMELPFVFDTLAITTGPKGMTGEKPPQDLAQRVHGIWVDFAKNGTLPWDEFSRVGRQVYQLEIGEAVEEPAMPAADFLP